MSQRSEFQIAYDGDALKSHTMAVADLAPALLAFGNLFDEANRVINGNRSTVKLQVKATAPASFDIIFQLDQSLAAQISGFLTGGVVTSTINLLTLLGFCLAGVKGAHVSLLWLIRKLRGKKPDKLIDLKNGFVQIDFEGNSFVVPVELLRLYQDIAVRRATEKILKPLQSDGIDTLKIFDLEMGVVETITKVEISYFALPEIEDEIILETEHQAAYSIISLAFKEDNKWRLYDGSATIPVAIEDYDFLHQVNNNLIAFSKGDLLICNVKTKQYRKEDGLKTEYTVLKVLEHRPAARQLHLFYGDNDSVI